MRKVNVFKRHIVAFAAVLLAATAAVAQNKSELPYRYEFGVSFSAHPELACDYYKKGAFIIGDVSPREDRQDDYLAYLYGDHRSYLYSLGSINFEGSIYLKPWLIQSFNVGFVQMWSSRIDNMTSERSGSDYGMGITLLPELKLITNRRHAFRVFCSFALGTGFYMGSGFDNMRRYDRFPSAIHQRLEFEWVPVGIMIGRKCYFYANAGLGTAYIGGRAGVAYRF